MKSLTLHDWIALAGIAAFFVETLLHLVSGPKLYIEGSNLGIEEYDDWTVQTPKQKLLYGMYMMADVLWWQNLLIAALVVIYGSPIGAWFGVIQILFALAQLALLAKNIGPNTIGKIAGMFYLVYIACFGVWTSSQPW